MFLYAHLILKGLDFLHSVEEIQRDLKVLPTDLNAAYERIFSRINESLPNEAARDKARKALGWIGYSPVALTIRELEQALIIKIGDLDQVPTGMSALQLVRLCGPVVEEVDGELQLVHFTAKEYFFSPMIKNSLDPAQCIMSLAKCCITYLCQHHHDANMDERLFQDRVINGVYRLHHFASNNWSRLVELYLNVAPAAKDSTDLAQLVAILNLLTIRANGEYLQSEQRTDRNALEALQAETSMDAYELVCNELGFHREASTRIFELGKGEWQVTDPLLIRDITTSLHTALESLICPTPIHRDPCHCQAIYRHYGWPFKCNFVGCDYQRLGFETLGDRRKHTKSHDRPWTCEVTDCEYHVVGFISRQMRDRHLDKAHRVDEPSRIVLRATVSNYEKIAVLKALIRANKFVRGTAAKQVFDRLDIDSQNELRVEAATYGTYELMDLLCSEWFLDKIQDFSRGDVVAAALKSQNRETLRWIQAISPEVPMESYNYVVGTWNALLESEDPEGMYQFVETWLHATASASAPRFSRRKVPDFFAKTCIGPTGRDYLKESILISAWSKLYASTGVSVKYWNVALSHVAATTLSIRLAGWLCDHGAPVNYLKSARRGPPLLVAAKRDTLESAKFMRFLLYKGADPECADRSGNAPEGPVSALKGPTGLHKWLGISWESLIEEAREARRSSDDPPIPIG
ncbi:hypothetical protein ACJ41O_014959 [Fusarium nematophilum]